MTIAWCLILRYSCDIDRKQAVKWNAKYYLKTIDISWFVDILIICVSNNCNSYSLLF